MSFFETLMNIISSLFGGNKPAQPAEQKQTLPPGVEEVVPHSDPRVAATNNGKGLITSYEHVGGQYLVHYENGQTLPFNAPDAPEKYIQNGISEMIYPKMLDCITAVRDGRDTSKWTEQQIFDAKVYLGRIVIEK